MSERPLHCFNVEGTLKETIAKGSNLYFTKRNLIVAELDMVRVYSDTRFIAFLAILLNTSELFLPC